MLAILFAIFAALHLRQGVMALVRGWDEPTPLVVLHLLIGVSASGAAVGTWRGSRLAPLFALSYGVITALMLAWLPSLLDLPPEARPGIWLGAASVLAFGIAASWWLRRRERQAPAA